VLDRGRLTADANLRTNLDNIMAIGDVTRGIGLAHWASHEGIAAAEMLFGGLDSPPPTFVPGVVFTSPKSGRWASASMSAGPPTSRLWLASSPSGAGQGLGDPRARGLREADRLGGGWAGCWAGRSSGRRRRT